MTRKEIIDGLKFTIEMFLFDTSTGETFTEPRNDMDKITINACRGAIELLSKSTKINLNDTIKVKLTDYGKEIYYHQFDKLNDWVKSKGCKLIEPKMPEVDEEGKTRFQLWSFMEMYGNYIGLTEPNFIEPLEIEIEEE